MILCPICLKEVRGENGQALREGEPDNFACPTYVLLMRNHRRSHYSRITLRGWFPEYELVAPPYQILFQPGPDKLKILDNSKGFPQSIFKEMEHATMDDAFDWWERLNNLKAFS